MQWTGNLRVHFLFEVSGYVAGAAVYILLRAKGRDSVGDQVRGTVLAGAALGAAVGARLLSFVSYPGLPLLAFFSGKTVVGGLLGGLIGVEIAKWMNGITRSTGDLFAYPLLTAMCIGRIGCFLAGPIDKTAGLPTTLPWGIAIGDGVKRHPVALYEIAFLLLLALALHSVRPADDLETAKGDGRRAQDNREPASLRPSSFALRPFQPGDRFRLFLASYLAFRLAVDFLKPEPPPLLLGLSAIQWACAAGLLYYGLVLSHGGRSATVRLLRRQSVELS